MPPRTMQAQVLVKYVNEAKNDSQYGSIADANKNYYSVPVDLLGNFRSGTVYNINYTERTVNGRTFKNFYSFADGPTQAAPMPSSSPAPRSAPQQSAQQANDHKDMLIWCTGLVGRAMGSGSFTASDIHELTVAAKAAYKVLTERDLQGTGEMEDDLPGWAKE